MFAISQISQTGKLNLKTKRAYHKQNTTYDTLFVVLLCLFHLAQQLFLSVIQRGWQLHVVCNHQIAKCSVTTVASFSTNPNLGSVLRSRLNLEFDFRTIAQSDNPLATQQGRIHIDVYVHLHFSCALTHILRAIFRSATKAIKDQEHIHTVIDNNTNVPDRSECIFGKGPSPVPEMVKSAKLLTAMGADVIIIGCNTAHYFLPEVQKQVKTPFINMIEETAKFCAEEGYRTLGLLASAGTCASGIYKKEFDKLGMTLLHPEEAEQEIIHEMIYEGVKATNYNYDATPAQNVLRAMEQRGVEAFILGCTEVPVAVQMYKLQGCFVDATEVLAEKAVAWAGGEVISSLPRKG